MSHPAPTWILEQSLWSAGYRYVAGMDEAGRGALAGPIVAAAVVFPPDAPCVPSLQDLNDSKKLSPRHRADLVPLILEHALTWAIGWASWEEVDALGVPEAARRAFLRTLNQLRPSPEYLLLDHLLLPEIELPQTALPKGDRRSFTIAAASILAKTVRDAYMEGLERCWPGYGLARHKGYGTLAHRQALHTQGPAPIHRRRFAPVQAYEAHPRPEAGVSFDGPQDEKE